MTIIRDSDVPGPTIMMSGVQLLSQSSINLHDICMSDMSV